MKKSLRIGFIGGGTNSAVGTTHFIAAQMDSRFKVEAGCFSRHTNVNIETAEHWHIPNDRCYHSIPQLLQAEKSKLDAIVVLTPTPLHVDHVIQALEQGYSVICEKALASSSDDASKILTAQNKYNAYLAVTYNYSGYPMLRELKQMIATEKLGRVKQIHIEMPQEGFSRLNREKAPMVPQEWRLHDGRIPTISLDLGTHIHHIIHYLIGEKPQELVAIQSGKGNFQQVIDNVLCIGRYSNDIECSIWFTKTALGYRNGLKVRVLGEVASAEWIQTEPEYVSYFDNTGKKRIIDRADNEVEIAALPRYNRFKAGHPAGFIEAFANIYWDIADEIESFSSSRIQNQASPYNAEIAYHGLKMLEAITDSSKSNSWKTLNI